MEGVKYIILYLCASVLLDNISCQDCITYGRTCGDNGQCCGGCCIEGVCIDTPGPCYIGRSPCLEHICPPAMECHIFKPENCPGCDIQAICQ